MGRRDDGKKCRTTTIKRVVEKSRKDQRTIIVGVKQGGKYSVVEI